MRRMLALLAPLVLVAACASTSEEAALSRGRLPAEDGGASAYGLFLAGQGAMNDGRGEEASSYFDQAQQTGESGDLIAERAFTAALLAGDIQKAAAVAPKGDEVSEPIQRLARMVHAVEFMAQGQGREAVGLLNGDTIGFPHRAGAALLAPWAAAMAGDMDGAVVRPVVAGDKSVEYFGQLGQAYLYERARRYDEAETDFKALTGGSNASDIVVLAYGGFLERRGRRPDAVALYDARLAASPNDTVLEAARTRAAAGKAAPLPPSLRQGAAQALIAPAAIMLAAKQEQLGLVYLRLALRLDPQRNEAWLMVGDIMEAGGDSAGARAAYSRPKPGSLEYAAGRAKLAWSYQNAKDTETALKLAREAVALGDPDAPVTLADLLRVNEHYAEAAEVLTGVIEGRGKADWRLLYARGVSYERAGRWSDAERDFQAALKLKPDEPELLNYLGYSWIDRGERLPEALAMVQKAVAANPRSGAMVDSLGWAYYRLGDYKKAVERLEQAIELEAGDPDINNHLGDAYWRVGRRDEAQFQWRRVLTLEPEAKMKAEVEAKLAGGLGPSGPVKAPRVAGN